MTVRNNVNLTRLEETVAAAQSDKSKTRRVQKIEGEWLLAQGEPQFRAEVNFEDGMVIMESDQPKNLGGSGSRPGPLQYCFLGLLACYMNTFATVASQMGIVLRRLTGKVETNINLSRVLGLSREPIMEEVHITLQMETGATREKLQEAEKLAYERCPAVFALTEPIRLKTTLEAQP